MTTLRDPKVTAFIAQCRQDCGFLGRNLLGYNYDKHELTNEITNIGTGGLRNYGPDKEMTDFLDKKGKKFKVMLAPRGTRKSFKLSAKVVQIFLNDPNARILYMMLDAPKAEKKSRGILECLRLPKVVELFGQQVPDECSINGWTLSTRTRKSLPEASFTTTTTSVGATSGHYDWIFIDDPIDEKWVSETMMERAKIAMQQVFPLLDGGGTLVLVGTRYSDEDVFADAISEPRWDKLILDSGDLEIIQKDDSTFEVVGTPRFPHHSLEYLNDMLALMKPKRFMAQYMNRIANDARDLFTREMFQPVNWNSDMALLSGYLLTDSATSVEKDGCFSVIAYVGLDQQHNTYLLDLKVGKWHPSELVDQFFSVLHAWRQKVNHVAETLEKNDAANQLMGHIQYVARVKGYKYNILRIQRIGNKDKKENRIRALQPVMAERRFFVVDTVPRTFMDLTGEKSLWDPEGHRDPKSGIGLPSGELVDQFTKLGSISRKDIADCIADIEAVDRKNNDARYCVFKAPRTATAWSLIENRQQRTRRLLSDSGRPMRLDDPSQPEDFWDRIGKQLGSMK